MSKFKVIPAIDLIDGKCVRLSQGDYDRKEVYDRDPVELAIELEAKGIEFLHVVDLDGAKSGKIVNWPILEKICQKTSLSVDFGGGLKTDHDLEIAFQSGASQVSIGSVAVKSRETFAGWLEHFGPEKMILSADVKNENVAINGWQKVSEWNVFDMISYYRDFDLSHVVCTDISKDGMLKGPGYELYAKMVQAFDSITLIASGGVSELGDVSKLYEMGMGGVIVGKALFEGRIGIDELVAWMKTRELC